LGSRTLGETQFRALLDDLAQAREIASVARAWDASPTAVRNFCARHGVNPPPPTKRPTPSLPLSRRHPRVMAIVELRNRGWAAAAIARRMGIPREQVLTLLEAAERAPARIPLPPSADRWVLRRLDDGATPASIAAEVGSTAAEVRRAAKRARSWKHAYDPTE
jgi:hypothetical protein